MHKTYFMQIRRYLYTKKRVGNQFTKSICCIKIDPTKNIVFSKVSYITWLKSGIFLWDSRVQVFYSILYQVLEKVTFNKFRSLPNNQNISKRTKPILFQVYANRSLLQREDKTSGNSESVYRGLNTSPMIKS